jgi:hypothetical protein
MLKSGSIPDWPESSQGLAAVRDFDAVLTGLGHFRQIDPLPTLSACPLRSHRFRTFAPAANRRGVP